MNESRNSLYMYILPATKNCVVPRWCCRWWYGLHAACRVWVRGGSVAAFVVKAKATVAVEVTVIVDSR